MFDSDDIPSNKSGNKPFEEVLKSRMERRSVLKGSLGVAATSFFAASPLAHAARGRRGRRSGRIDFTPVSVAEGNGPIPVISPDYEYTVILPWGDPIEASGPEYNYPPSSADQAVQIGIGHDGMTYFPMRDRRESRWGWDNHNSINPWNDNRLGYGQGNQQGVLCINFEFGDNGTVLAKPAPDSLDDVRISQHAHGVGVIELMQEPGINGEWKTVDGNLSRRIHVNTPVEFSGPVAGSPLLENPNGNIPLGTVNNCSNGFTPWGTYLTCEENFNGYFGWTNPGYTPTASQERYGFGMGGFGYGWHLFDKRFDLSDEEYVNECNRFGWVVEIDPFDPTSKPVKRTALGRIKHEGATVHVDEATGRVVVYQGDDQRFDYIYKFVSAAPWRDMIAEGKSPLDEGTLYVAQFNDNGTGSWLELSMDTLGHVFSNMAELLIDTRIAADEMGATPMDRPEWITVAPDDQVYCTLTNNSQRTVPNGPNPIVNNQDGHIIRWTETAGFTGTSFEWDIFLIAEDTHGTEESFSDPDGIWADPEGRIFIQTDGGQKDGLNNQMLVADSETGDISRLITGTGGCEITGLTYTPDCRTMFINIQHPGNGDPTVTNFPVLNTVPDGVTVPRDATIVIRRKDGGVIGS